MRDRKHMKRNRWAVGGPAARLGWAAAAALAVLASGGHAQAAVIFSAGPTTPTLFESGFLNDGVVSDGPDVANQVLYEDGGEVMRMVGDVVIDISSTGTRTYGVRMFAFNANVSTTGAELLNLFWDFDVEVISGSPVFDVTVTGFTRVGETPDSQTIRLFDNFSATTHFEGSALGEFSTVLGGSADLQVVLSFDSRTQGDQVVLTLPEGGGVWITAVPEPAAAALLGVGALALIGRWRRRRTFPVGPNVRGARRVETPHLKEWIRHVSAPVVAALSAAALIVSSAQAVTTLYETGYEPPTYTLGALAPDSGFGQDNWLLVSGNAGASNVQTVIVNTGEQAVEVDAGAVTGLQQVQSRILFPSYDSVGNPEQVVKISQAMYLESGGATNQIWVPLAGVGPGGFTGFIGQVLWFESSGVARLHDGSSLTGSVAVSFDEWHVFDLYLDYATQTQTAYVDGTLIGSIGFANAVTEFSSASFGLNNAGGGGGGNSAFFDDLSVTSIPEPATAALLGLSGLTLLRRRG